MRKVVTLSQGGRVTIRPAAADVTVALAPLRSELLNRLTQRQELRDGRPLLTEAERDLLLIALAQKAGLFD